MISELKYRWFISLSQKAKQLPRHHTKPATVKISKKKHAPIQHLSLKNQRRIKRLREKKESDKEIVKLLRQEAKEHKLTRDQLEAAVQYIKHEHQTYKEGVERNKERLKILKQLHAQLDDVKAVISTLSMDDPESIKLQSQIVRIEKLINHKEKELHLD